MSTLLSKEFEGEFLENPLYALVAASRGINDHVDTATKELQMKMTTVCTGCVGAWCCRRPAFVTILEAAVLASAVFAAGQDTKTFRRTLRKRGEEMEELPTDVFIAMQRDCVFLIDNKCQYYADRPSLCRRLFSIEDTAEACRPAEKGFTRHVDFSDLDRNVERISEEILGYASVPDTAMTLRALPKQVLTLLEMNSSSDPLSILRKEVALPTSRVQRFRTEAALAETSRVSQSLGYHRRIGKEIEL